MPPKVRRPAAVVAAPEVGVRRARGLRRPAAAVIAEKEGVGAEELECAKLSLEQCHTLKDFEVINGSYWDAPLQAALRAQEIRVRGDQTYLVCQVLGTQS